MRTDTVDVRLLNVDELGGRRWTCSVLLSGRGGIPWCEAIPRTDFKPRTPRNTPHEETTAILDTGRISIRANPRSGPGRVPNIVFILCDDLGYGDVKCLNPDGKIATPNIDRLAAAGMRFTDAHSGSAVCTPTRYGLLTGRYNWLAAQERRARRHESAADRAGPADGAGIPSAAGLPHRLHRQVAPRHGLAAQAGQAGASTTRSRTARAGWNVDFTQPIANGPNSVGFDYYFGIARRSTWCPTRSSRTTASPWCRPWTRPFR